jgi:hypothetical protein
MKKLIILKEEIQMKKKLDFSKGIKGKFYIPEKDIKLPVCLNENNQVYYTNLAKEKKMAVSQLINALLSKEREIIKTVISKK